MFINCFKINNRNFWDEKGKGEVLSHCTPFPAWKNTNNCYFGKLITIFLNWWIELVMNVIFTDFFFFLWKTWNVLGLLRKIYYFWTRKKIFRKEVFCIEILFKRNLTICISNFFKLYENNEFTWQKCRFYHFCLKHIV